ncbi:hypothetical protein ABIB25_005664 [Nakamurella sp. UYEF19]
MTPLGWGWAAFVWVYALAWFLINDRIKLLAYRIFDNAGRTSMEKADTPLPKQQRASDTTTATTIDSAAFYTDADPRDPVFHDNIDCPYGAEIKSHQHDQPGTGHRRRCDWCAQHD